MIATGNLKVLCVEDDPDIREIFTLALELSEGVEVQSCGSGREALAICAEVRFDVILLDVMMPEMDGPATLAQLRQLPEMASTAAIFVTAKATREELQRLTGLGAKGVISKPVNPLTLMARVREILGVQAPGKVPDPA
jgi:two-component system, OmpR family, response regulator